MLVLVWIHSDATETGSRAQDIKTNRDRGTKMRVSKLELEEPAKKVHRLQQQLGWCQSWPEDLRVKESSVCEHTEWGPPSLQFLRLVASLGPLTILNPIFYKPHLSKPCSAHVNG